MADRDELLNILQAHGENFLSSFAGTSALSKGKSNARPVEPTSYEIEESEWEGIQSDRDESESEEEEDFEENDDDFTSATTSINTNVVVFSDIASTFKIDPASQSKAFMSSKISKVREEAGSKPKQSTETMDDDDVKERSNIQNDALLHKLVHTQLLSGSRNTELELTPAQRRKALSGRILELSGDAKLGRGERSVRTAEHNKASKRVREGLIQKQKERRIAQLEETKNLGNYHPKLKRLFDEDSETAKPKKRVRGLQMGVGSFKGGTLRLSREEINSVQGQIGGSTRGRGSARGRRGRK